MSSYIIHVFDAIARDQKVIRATEDSIEVEYVSDAGSADSTSYHNKYKKKSKSPNDNAKRELVIHLFGMTEKGESVRIEVNGFQPFFFVALPECNTPTEVSRMKNKLQEKICIHPSFNKLSSLMKFELVYKQKLIGYTGGKTFPFLKISMPSLGMFYELRKFFQDDRQQPKVSLAPGQKPLEVFESNIDPMLRFFHIRDLQTCGWICVKGCLLESDDDSSTIKIQADWDAISPSPAPLGMVSAPFKHAFWDIECYSHDKEFPVAYQGYRRVAKQLWNMIGVNEVHTIPELLKEGFGEAANSKILIPPFKVASYKPRPKDIASIVDSSEFRGSLKELWDGRDGRDGGLLVKEREERLANLTKLLDTSFKRMAPIAGDPIIQIGTVVLSNGVLTRHIFVLGGCSPIEGAEVHSYKTEKELLMSWFSWIVEENFDIMSGYNIFGFDERYVWDRLVELGLEQEECVQRLTRLWDEGGEMKLQEKFLSSSALGDNMLHMWNTPGRLRIDLYGHIKRKVQLSSYKLDSVCAAFLSGKLLGISSFSKNRWLLKTKQKSDARLGRYVQVLNDLGEDLSEKMEIVEIAENGIVVVSEEDLSVVTGAASRWAIVKDDVSPQELFRLHRGSDKDRARIGAYCIQDCELVYELYKKLEVFNEAMSMANVCSVPVSYIFTRGQGIKIESLIFKDCMLKGQLIVVQPGFAFGTKDAGAAAAATDEEGYEGAIVLDPIPGFYADSPIGVCDFASLYPSTIISENISHDMLVWTKDYDLEGNLVCVARGSVEAERLAPEGTKWTDIEFDILRPDPADTHKHPKKIRAGTRLCRYAQPPGDGKGSLPQIVAKLLAARKAKRAEIQKTDDPFKKALLDAEQNAYKITANSLYGQLGSRTFKIRLQDLAASVTAYARKQIMFSKDAIEQFYGPEAADPRCSAEITYGDTDSLFVNFNPRNPETGERLLGREAIVATIALTEEAGHFITGTLKAPHDFEYDKVFYPFIIFSKKRYVGNKYEDSPDDFKETSMGIVLKRRDNAPLLKMIYGGAIDRLLNRRDVVGAVEFVKEKVKELVEGKMKLSQLTITKSLSAEYAGTPPAHKVLADRIAARDPGNAPSSGDRVGFIYVKPAPGQLAGKLQGDRVETPAWIQEKGLVPDAEYYIEHQLMNPLSQLFGILLEKMPGFVVPRAWATDPEKLIAQRESLANDLLFREGLQAYKQSATRDFIAKLGPGPGPGPATKANTGIIRNNLVPMTPIVPMIPKKQSLMDSFMKESSFVGDNRLAREIRSIRGKKSKAASTDSK